VVTVVARSVSLGLVVVSIWRAFRIALPILAASILAESSILDGTVDVIAVDSTNAKESKYDSVRIVLSFMRSIFS